MQIKKQGCEGDDCHAKYPCSRCTPLRPESLCVTFEPDAIGPYDDPDPPACCLTTKTGRLKLFLGRRTLIRRPHPGDPPPPETPEPEPFYDVTCPSDQYRGTIECDNVILTFTVTVEELPDACRMRVHVHEAGIGDEEEFFRTFPIGSFVFSHTFYYEGDFLSGDVTIGVVPRGYLNTKYRGLCPPEQLETFEDCQECKSCDHCKCLPHVLCIGYETSSVCGTSIEWKRAPFDIEGQSYSQTFVVTNEDGEEEDRSVALDFCWHRTFDNYGAELTRENLFTQCAFSLQVPQKQYSDVVTLDWIDDETRNESGCIFDQGDIVATVSDEDDEITEVVRVRHGSCGCPADVLPGIAGCGGMCPELFGPVVVEGENECPYVDPIYLTLIAPGYCFDGVIIPLRRGIQPPIFDGLLPEQSCPLGFGTEQYEDTVDGGYRTCCPPPLGYTEHEDDHVSWTFYLYYDSPPCVEEGAPVPGRYRLAWAIDRDTTTNGWGLGRADYAIPPGAAECHPLFLEFAIPQLIGDLDGTGGAVTGFMCQDPQSEYGAGEIIARITL